MKTGILGNIAFALVFALSACGGTTPTANHVTITGADIKFGDPAAPFTALVQDSSNITVMGKTFTWNSSNTDVATVDTNGLVTPKHVGTFKISATSDGIIGESSSFRIYGLDVIGGVARYSDTPNLYFGLYYRILLPGTATTPDGAISITGPATFNTGTALPVAFTGTIAQSGTSTVPNALVIGGTYQASTTVNGQSYSRSFSINTNDKLEFPTGINLSAVAASSITVSWVTVVNAERYLAGVNPSGLGGNKLVLKTQALTTALNGTPALDTTKTYKAFVQASNLNTDLLPTQFNSALQYVPVTF